MKHDELILAVRRDELEGCVSHGFTPLNPDWMFEQLRSAGLWLGPRRLLEQDESLLQLILYTVLVNADGVLCYRRAPSGGESRLHGQLSLGIGGHVDAVDVVWNEDSTVDLNETLEVSADREVSEEVGNLVLDSSTWLGILCDEHNAVGRVHIGIAQLWLVDGSLVTKPEHAIADPHVRNWAEVAASADEFETWSRFLAQSTSYLQSMVGVLRDRACERMA